MIIFFLKIFGVIFAAPSLLGKFLFAPFSFYQYEKELNSEAAFSSLLWGSAMYRFYLQFYAERLEASVGSMSEALNFLAAFGTPIQGDLLAAATLIGPAISISLAQMVWSTSFVLPLKTEYYFALPVTVFGFSAFLGGMAIAIGLLVVGTDPQDNTVQNLRTVKICSDFIRLSITLVLLANFFRLFRPHWFRFSIGLAVFFSVQGTISFLLYRNILQLMQLAA